MQYFVKRGNITESSIMKGELVRLILFESHGGKKKEVVQELRLLMLTNRMGGRVYGDRQCNMIIPMS